MLWRAGWVRALLCWGGNQIKAWLVKGLDLWVFPAKKTPRQSKEVSGTVCVSSALPDNSLSAILMDLIKTHIIAGILLKSHLSRLLETRMYS